MKAEREFADSNLGGGTELDIDDEGDFKAYINTLRYEVEKIKKVPNKFLTLAHETIDWTERGEEETESLEDVLDAAAEEFRSYLDAIVALKARLRSSNESESPNTVSCEAIDDGDAT